jgi:hypothetical protein
MRAPFLAYTNFVSVHILTPISNHLIEKTHNNKTRNNKTHNNKTHNNKTCNNKTHNYKTHNNKTRNSKTHNIKNLSQFWNPVLAGGASIAAALHAARVLGINLRPLQGLVCHKLGTISVEVTPFRYIIAILASLPHPQQLYN